MHHPPTTLESLQEFLQGNRLSHSIIEAFIICNPHPPRLTRLRCSLGPLPGVPVRLSQWPLDDDSTKEVPLDGSGGGSNSGPFFRRLGIAAVLGILLINVAKVVMVALVMMMDMAASSTART